nr:hypothetical protein [Tanacetum cinerariifolium]
EPANVAEALKDADWVSGMQEELDQFARLKDVGKLKAKGDIGVFVGYSKESAAFRIYNKQTRKIHESVNVNFDELSEMASKQFSLEHEEVILPQTNTQSIPINIIPNVDEASTSHNVFNERLEDAYFDAKALRDADWVSAMQEELDQFARLKVWRLVPRPEGKSVIKTKWIFKNKKDESSLVIRNKARLIVVGYSQQEGIDYDETFAPQYPDHVYALDKALYGLKQAPRAWYDTLSQFLIESDFQKVTIDTTLFIKKKVPTPMVKQAKLKLDLVGKLVDHTDYRSMIGSLMYVTSSRPDIMFATCMCARYQANPNEHHVSAVKRIFCYLKGTINLGLWYLKDSGFDLTTYSDADHAGCHLDRKTESEYVAVSGCCAQVLWMRTQLTDYGFFYDKKVLYGSGLSDRTVSGLSERTYSGLSFSNGDLEVAVYRGKTSVLVKHDLEGTSWRYGMGKEKVNEVDFISQRVELTLGGSGGESIWEEGDYFKVDVLRFHTCLTDIFGFLEKLKWWFKQDIDDEEVWMKRMKIIERIRGDRAMDVTTPDRAVMVQ